MRLDTADISGNEVGHIAAHPAVFHNGNEAGHQQYHGYRTEAQDELHFHRKLEFTYISTYFSEHSVCINMQTYIKNVYSANRYLEL